MENDLLFGFTVDKETYSIRVTRKFKANIALVWDAWTKAEILDQWWAPRPYHVETKSLDLKVGGRWFYAMVSPKDEKQWCKADYKAIQSPSLLTWLDAFCEEDGTATQGKPRSLWDIAFTENEGTTSVQITIKHDSLTDLEEMISMGFKEGCGMALGNLNEVLAELTK